LKFWQICKERTIGPKTPVPLPVIGSAVTTACGGEEEFSSDTPRVLFEGKWIFFCTPLCQQDFIQDPSSSCYADQIENRAE
jgi:YHS domain-containing protein